MENYLKTGMVVGTASGREWSQVASQAVPQGQLLILVRVKYAGEGDVLEPAAVGAGVLESLKLRLGGIGDLAGLEEEIREVREGLGEEVEVGVGAALVKNQQLMTAGYGPITALLKRGEKFAKLWEGKHEKPGVTGQLFPNDVLMLVTAETEKHLAAIGWEKLDGGEEMLERLAVKVHAESDSSGLAVIVGKVGEEEAKRGSKQKVDWEQLARRVKTLGQRPVKIRQDQKRRNMIVGGGLLAILALGVAVGLVSRTAVRREQRYQRAAELVESKLREAREIGDLNPERARAVLTEAKNEVERFAAEAKEDSEKNKASGLSQQIEKAEEEVFRETKVKLETLTELKLLEAEGSKVMTGDGKGNLYLWAEGKGRAVGVNTEDKSSWRMEAGEVKEVLDITMFRERLLLLSKEGVWETEEGEGAGRKIIEPDELWKGPIRIASFLGNIYVLDGVQGEIWKYPALNEGYGERRRWFGAGIVLDLSKVSNWEVDGEIWLITDSGKLERYSMGVPVRYEMEGFPAKEAGRLLQPTAVTTSEERVYVLEAGAKRVVVLNKETGKYEKQLVHEEFGQGQELVVYKNRGYVLLTDRIGWFEL